MVDSGCPAKSMARDSIGRGRGGFKGWDRLLLFVGAPMADVDGEDEFGRRPVGLLVALRLDAEEENAATSPTGKLNSPDLKTDDEVLG